MTERAPIPEDLMKVAREVYDALYRSEDEEATHELWRDKNTGIILTALAAERERATLAERARCAAIARAAGDTWSGTRDATQACQEAAVDDKCEEIAAAIARP